MPLGLLAYSRDLTHYEIRKKEKKVKEKKFFTSKKVLHSIPYQNSLKQNLGCF